MTVPNDPKDLAAFVAATRADRFAPGFADRVAARIAARAVREREAPLVLARHVRRIVPLVAAASLVLAATNWWSARDTGASPLAGALGLPSATVADALTLSSTTAP